MNAEIVLQQLHVPESRRVVHVQALPARKAVYGNLARPLDDRLQQALARIGALQLYSHQVEAIDHVREGRSVVVVTGTASGKTMCYNLPVVQSILDDALATAIYIFPTKALAQDQLRSLENLRQAAGLKFQAGTYDGDTPTNLRRKLRDKSSVILTNPDMLHTGILPNHARWNRFFTHLRYVVIDEVHSYRGVFGSHLANVIRRLRRICRHYGSRPQFVCCSATIGNPREHAERICGQPVELIDRDGSPRGHKRFVLWNPPLIDRTGGFAMAGGDRRSALSEAVNLMSDLVSHRVQTIGFVRTRQAAELLFRYCKQRLARESRKLADSVHAYRGGYLPEQRREIERRLASAEIMGIASTNALELGIDIGSLDACIMVGYPGTVASTWQQAGRAGRGTDDALVFLIGQNAPIDQYLMGHHDYLFGRNPEQTVVDPDNPHVAIGHIRSALYELPLADEEAESFGPYSGTILELLEEDQSARHIDGKWYWASQQYPAQEVSLRNISGSIFTIQDAAAGNGVIGTLDEVSAYSQIHTHAVYLHEAETYFVEKLDLDKKIAFVAKQELDYYTQAVSASQIQIDRSRSDGCSTAAPGCAAPGFAVPDCPSPPPAGGGWATEAGGGWAAKTKTWRGCQLSFGDVTVVTSIPMFKKIKFGSRESIGFEKLDLPPQQVETVAMWLVPPPEITARLREQGLAPAEGLIGIGNVMVEVAPLFVMCDVQDIGVVVDAANLGADALFLYDRHPGGMGYAERCEQRIEELMRSVADVIRQCPCEEGCPSCVGAPMPAFAMTDLDSAMRGRIPNKAAARAVVEEMLNEVQQRSGDHSA